MKKKSLESTECFSESFALQYISLILFILIFTIWSYIPQFTKQVPQILSNNFNSSETKSNHEIIFKSDLTKKYFKDDFLNLRSESWEPLKLMLNQHDLSLVIKVKSFESANAIYFNLINYGFPIESISVTSNPKVQSESLEIIKGYSVWPRK